MPVCAGNHAMNSSHRVRDRSTTFPPGHVLVEYGRNATSGLRGRQLTAMNQVFDSEYRRVAPSRREIQPGRCAQPNRDIAPVVDSGRSPRDFDRVIICTAPRTHHYCRYCLSAPQASTRVSASKPWSRWDRPPEARCLKRPLGNWSAIAGLLSIQPCRVAAPSSKSGVSAVVTRWPTHITPPSQSDSLTGVMVLLGQRANGKRSI